MSTTNGYYASPIKTRLSDNEPIPKGWRWVDLQEVARLESGHTPSRKIPEYWAGGDVPWLSLKDIRGMKYRYVEDTIDKPTMLGIDNSSARMLPKGTVAFCRTASVGNVAILGRDMATSQDFVDWVCGPNLLPEYLYEAFKASGPTFASEMQGSTHQTIYMPSVKRFKVLLPPLSEQKRIADILDKADAIRRKRQEELDALSALRSSVFLRLFGDPRIQRTDWHQVNLGDVTILDAPMVDPREDEYIDLVHLGPDRIEKNTGRLLPALTARDEGLISGKFLFDDRYLLYSKIRPYLRKVALPHFKGLCSADVYPIRPVEKVTTREYLFALLISEAFLSYTTSLPSRASIPKLNRKELAAYTFCLPPIELQQQYTETLRSHEHTTQTFCKASDESEHLFNALVQLAFKGEL
ncbi:MAG: restriction endonuclease subunit S [Pirellulaceae bacterium]|nr:restriction endonuclease subunit S [Pirellulaceae bacterium]